MARAIEVAPRHVWHVSPRLAQFVRQLSFVLAAYGAYRFVRIVTESSRQRAMRHATGVLQFEQRLSLDWEHGAQAQILGHREWIETFNLLYTWIFWPFVIGALVLLYVRNQGQYRIYRNALFVSGSMGLVVFAVFPVAPPRMLDGFVDTIQVYSGQGGVAHPGGFTNEFAAMPSFHVGWTVLAGVAMMPLVRRRVARLLLLVPGVVMAITVVVTANHYVLDGFVGVAFVLVGLRVSHLYGRSRVVGEATKCLTPRRNTRTLPGTEPARGLPRGG